MLYTEFVVNENKVYKLRLNTRNTILLEKKLGNNPVVELTKYLAKEEIPPIELMVNVLHYSLQAYHHGIDIEETYNLLDEWLDNGHLIAEFLGIIIEIYRLAGLIQKEDNEKN